MDGWEGWDEWEHEADIEDGICLDGHFTAEDLEQIARLMRDKSVAARCARIAEDIDDDDVRGESVAREIREEFGLKEPEPFVYVSPADEAFRRLAERAGQEEAIKAVRVFQDRHGMPHGSPIGRRAEYIAALDAWPGPDPATVPTEEGRRRYPPDGMWDSYPCRCKPECEAHPCTGSCGCTACALAYGDAMDYADY